MADPFDGRFDVFVDVFDVLVGTFGPFLVPAAVFLAGLIGYGVLLVLTRRYGSERSRSSIVERRKD